MPSLLPSNVGVPGRKSRRPARGCGRGCAFTVQLLPFGGSCNYSFTNETPGGIGWLWDFGDGNTSDLENPSHAYVDGGIYTVTLRVFFNTGDLTGDGIINSADFLAWQRGESLNPGSSEDLQLILDNFGGSGGPAYKECSQEVECNPPVITSCQQLEFFFLSHRTARFDLFQPGTPWPAYPDTYCADDCTGISGMTEDATDPFRPGAPVVGIRWILPPQVNQTQWLICGNTHMNLNATVTYSCNIDQLTGEWSLGLGATYQLTAGTLNNPPHNVCPGDRKSFSQRFILPGGQFPVAQSWLLQRFELPEASGSPEECCGEGDIRIGVQLFA